MIVSGDEIVGLCGYHKPPRNGEVEIGYGIAQSHRKLGHATRAVAAIIEHASQDSTIKSIVAETTTSNLPSGRVLANNGFVQVGTRHSAEDGDLICWRKNLV